MEDAELTAWITEASRELTEVAAIAGSRSPVPACPDWTMRRLIAHVISGLSGWYTYNLTHGAERLDYAASWNSQPRLPSGNADRLVRLVEAADEFAQLVRSLDLDAPCHVFQSRRSARDWVKRAATETAVHLRDAQEVLGEVTPWPDDRAAASIDETLRVMWHGALLLNGDLGADCVPDEPITVTATDLGLAWRVAKASDDFVVEQIDPTPAATSLSVTGPSHDLIPWLWGRTADSRPTVRGEPGAVEAWNLSSHLTLPRRTGRRPRKAPMAKTEATTIPGASHHASTSLAPTDSTAWPSTCSSLFFNARTKSSCSWGCFTVAGRAGP